MTNLSQRTKRPRRLRFRKCCMQYGLAGTGLFQMMLVGATHTAISLVMWQVALIFRLPSFFKVIRADEGA